MTNSLNRKQTNHLAGRLSTHPVASSYGLFLDLIKKLFAIGILAVAAVQFTQQTYNQHKSTTYLDGIYVDTLGLNLQNEYPTLESAGLYPWMGLVVEPWRETTLSLTNDTEIPDFLELYWEVHEESRDKSSKDGRGRLLAANVAESLVVTFERAGEWHLVETHIRDRNQIILRKLEHRLLCKYVRRELRQLNDEDKDRYLSALEVVHRVSLAEGQALYGPRFKNFEYFTEKHLWRMTLDKCTPWHGGDVFITSHAAFSLELEQSLQAVDPRVANAYWDYTLDDHLYQNDWRSSSPILTADWFGQYANSTTHVSTHKEFKPSTATHAVDNGHFAYIPVPDLNSAGNHPERNSYGYITDAINNNPSPFVTRVDSICGLPSASKLPGCKELKGALSKNDLSGFTAQIEYIFHGILHMQIGGVDQCATSFLHAIDEHPHWPPYLEAIGLTLNTLWRSMMNLDLLICPTSCGKDVPFEECACSCPKYDYWVENMTFYDAYPILSSFGGDMLQMLLNGVVSEGFLEADDDFENGSSTVHFHNLTMTEDAELMKFLLEVLCHPGRISQFATPLAAPNDPIFWPIHTTFDRVWAFMRLDPTKEFSGAWENEDPNACAMHGYHDLLPFQGLVGNLSDDRSYSNQQLYDLFDPKSRELPYIYDSFHWDHCGSSQDKLPPHQEDPTDDAWNYAKN